MPKKSYSNSEIGEETFKGSKWTLFSSHACYPFSPYHNVAIQAPKEVAKALIYKLFGYNPESENCHQHGSMNWDIYEDSQEQFPEYWITGVNTGTLLAIRYDSVGHYLRGEWDLPGYELKRYHRGNSPSVSLLSRLVHEAKLLGGSGTALPETLKALLLEYEKQPL